MIAAVPVHCFSITFILMIRFRQGKFEEGVVCFRSI